MMYSPMHYREKREDLIYEIIQKYSFATLISVSPEGPIISHLPMIMDASKKVLLSHCARANPHWKHFNNGQIVTLVFNGPHCYVSPAWYQPQPDNVPTWNYVTVHIQGKVRIIEDSTECWNSMIKLVNHYEKMYSTGWSLPDTPNETLKNDIQRGITVFEISMDKIESKFKLSQNQDRMDRNSVITKLTASHGEYEKQIASYMKRV